MTARKSIPLAHVYPKFAMRKVEFHQENATDLQEQQVLELGCMNFHPAQI